MGTKKQYCIGCEAKGVVKVADEIIEHEGEKIPVCKKCKRILKTQLESLIWTK
mgnify:CR=1 FL=1